MDNSEILITLTIIKDTGINKKDLLSLVTQVYKKNVKSKKKFVLRPVLYFSDDDDDEN
jgi:hypothetical protein